MFKIPLFGLSSVFYTSCIKKEPYLFIGKTHKFKNCLNLMTLHEKVQSLLMEMVLSFYATDLVDMKDYEAYLVDKEYQSMSFKELQASLIQLFHNDRVHPDSLIHNGIGKKELLEILVEMKKRMSH